MDILERILPLYQADDPGGANLDFEEPENPGESEETTDFLGIIDDSLPVDPYPNESKEEIMARMKALESQLAETNSRADEISAMRQGFETLAQSLQRKEANEEEDVRPTRQDQGNQQPFNEAEYASKFNETVYDDPYKNFSDLVMKKFGPEVQALVRKQIVFEQRELARDPQRADTYKQYRSEIDKEFGKLSPADQVYDPDAYIQAHDRVVARHIDDIVTKRVQQQIDAMGESEKSQNTGQNPAVSTKPGYSEAGGVPSPPKPKPGSNVRKPNVHETTWMKIHGLEEAKGIEILNRRADIRERVNKGIY